MKRVVLLLFLSTVCFAGCKKTEADKRIRDSVIGSWELRRASGMMTTVYPLGTGNILKFTTSGYQRYTAGQLAESGTYKIVRDGSVEENTCLVIADGQFENRIVFSKDDKSRKVFLQFSNDTLQFVSGCFAYDAGSFSDYIKTESSAIIP